MRKVSAIKTLLGVEFKKVERALFQSPTCIIELMYLKECL